MSGKRRRKQLINNLFVHMSHQRHKRDMRKKLATILLIISKTQCLMAQSIDSTKQSGWTYHFQLTVIDQNHSGFKPAYSGTNSLADSVETGTTSITTTL